MKKEEKEKEKKKKTPSYTMCHSKNILSIEQQ